MKTEKKTVDQLVKQLCENIQGTIDVLKKRYVKEEPKQTTKQK